jgi:hypothetical protein
MNNLLNMIAQIKGNPSKFFGNMQGVNMNDPNAIIQHLLNTGQVTQNAVNNAMQMQNNPIVRQFFNNKL